MGYCRQPATDTIASTHLRDDGLAFDLPRVDADERQPSCGLHAGDSKDVSAPSPRTRFTVRRFGGSFGA